MKKRWRKIVAAGLAGVLAMTFTGCDGKNGGEKKGKFYDCQRGFYTGWERKMCETPDGYYTLVGNYLMFVEKDLSKTAIVCNKAECLHCEEPMDHKANCNAFFLCASAIDYYDGKLYILSNDFSEIDGGNSIFEVTADGSGRREIYEGGQEAGSFVIHRGNAYVYEKTYADKEGKLYQTPHVLLTKVPLDTPKKTSVLWDTEEYDSINHLRCYENYCYFSADYLTNDERVRDSRKMKIDLDTGELSVCEELLDFSIANGFLFNRILLETSEDGYAWKSGYNRCSLDGKVEKTYTEQDFEIIGKDTVCSYGADDKYIYFKDIEYGDNMVPQEERKMYVYTYDGEFVCDIPMNEFSFPNIYIGNEKYMFLTRNVSDGEGEGTYEYYYPDKELFGKGAKFEKFMSQSVDLFSASCSFSYE